MLEFFKLVKQYTPDGDPLESFTFSPLGGPAFDFLKGVMQSWYGLCVVIGGAGFIISLMLAAIKLMIASRSGHARQEFKETLGSKLISLMALSGITIIVGLIATMIEVIMA